MWKSSEWIALAAIVSPIVLEIFKGVYNYFLKRNNFKLEIKKNRDTLLYDYFDAINAYYEYLEGVESKLDKIILKNRIITIKNKFLMESEDIPNWNTYSVYEENFDKLISNIKDTVSKESEKQLLVNVIDIIARIVQNNCDDPSKKCQKELKFFLEVLPIFQVWAYGNENIKKNEESLMARFDLYFSEIKKYSSVSEEYKIKDRGEESVSEYFKRIFKNFEKADQKKIVKKIGNENQYGRIHKNLVEKSNESNYVKIQLDGQSYNINKNCNRDVAEKFILEDILKIIKEN